MSGGSGSGQGPTRGAVLAGLSALLTAVGHLAAGGTLPELSLLVVLVPLLAGVLVTVADRCRGAVGTVATLGAGQVLLHYLMVVLHQPHPVADPAALSGWRMLGMHAAVTLATAVALRQADTAVVGLRAALRRVVRRRLIPPPAHRPLPTLAIPGPAVPARLARALSGAHLRRGPPVGC